MHSTLVRLVRSVAVVGTLALSLVVSTGPANASGHDDHPGQGHSRYVQTNLVADTPGRAQVTDPNLVNPWGVSYGPTTPLWVSNQGTGTSTLYSGGIHGGTQNVAPLVVTIPGGGPTGQVFNPTTDFVVHGSDGSSAPARFIFVGVTGHLTGWAPTVPAPAPSTNAQDVVFTQGAAFTGLAIASTDSGSRLYAADFTAGTVDVYNGTYQRVITPGNFLDPRLPFGYSPFNVQAIGGRIYVSYAKIDRTSGRDVPGKGLGRVNVFDFDGNLIERIHDTSDLNAPWGLTIAPAGFGKLSGDLLVGNFGDGRIHAYDANTLTSHGVVRNAQGRAIIIDGLWALTPGNGVEAGTDQVIFTAGPNNGMHGLLGTISLR